MKPRFRQCPHLLRSLRYISPSPLHVTHCDQEHLIALSSEEASTLVDACALLLLASRTAPGCELNSRMNSLLSTLFDQFSSHSV
jgi:hypothetical protein